jgi:hypothetical protein
MGRMTPWQRAGVRFSAVSHGRYATQNLLSSTSFTCSSLSRLVLKDPMSYSNLPLRT